MKKINDIWNTMGYIYETAELWKEAAEISEMNLDPTNIELVIQQFCLNGLENTTPLSLLDMRIEDIMTERGEIILVEAFDRVLKNERSYRQKLIVLIKEFLQELEEDDD